MRKWSLPEIDPHNPEDDVNFYIPELTSMEKFTQERKLAKAACQLKVRDPQGWSVAYGQTMSHLWLSVNSSAIKSCSKRKTRLENLVEP